MRKLTKLVILLPLLASCKECPECPPCETAVKAEESEAAKADGGLEETDAGVTAAGVGGQPREVTTFPLHGRAGFDKVNIWERPDMDSPRLGYMRKGQRTRLGDPQFASESCPKGWYQLPEGGFVCQGRGMLVGTKPRYIHRPPPKPALDEIDPYRHGFIRRDWTPLYKGIPTEEQIWSPPKTEPEGELLPDAGPFEGQVRPPCAPEEDKEEEATEKDVGEEEEIPCADYRRYARRNFRNIRDFLSRGFWVSVANRLRDDDTREYYYETIKGDFVPGNSVHLVRSPTFRGYEVLGDSPMPAAIVRSRNAAYYQLRNGKYRGIGPAERLAVHRVIGESDGKGTKFYQIAENKWLKSTQVEHFQLREIPEGVGDDEKWIYIDLSRQTLEAYDGATPVYATLISSGLPDSEETVTPSGRFEIEFKHISDDMAGSVGDNEEVYSVADVPYVQYIHRNIALHGSFWHSRYGSPKSHGCINLSPADAKFLFNWSDPPLPEGWHAVAATEKGPTTRVIIEGETPR